MSSPETEAMADAERAARDADALEERLAAFLEADRVAYPVAGDKVRESVEMVALTTVCARVIAANVMNLDAAAHGVALFTHRLQRQVFTECVRLGKGRRRQ